MTFLPWQLYSLVVMLGIVSVCIFVIKRRKTWACTITEHCLGRIYWYVDHAHGAADQDWQWVAAGFVIFRILDMWKPGRSAGLIAMYMAAWGS